MCTSSSDVIALRETGIEMVQERQYSVAKDLLTRYIAIHPEDIAAAIWLAYALPLAEGYSYVRDLVARFPLDAQVAACFGTFSRWQAIASRPTRAQNVA